MNGSEPSLPEPNTKRNAPGWLMHRKGGDAPDVAASDMDGDSSDRDTLNAAATASVCAGDFGSSEVPECIRSMTGVAESHREELWGETGELGWAGLAADVVGPNLANLASESGGPAWGNNRDGGSAPEPMRSRAGNKRSRQAKDRGTKDSSSCEGSVAGGEDTLSERDKPKTVAELPGCAEERDEGLGSGCVKSSAARNTSRCAMLRVAEEKAR